MPEVGPSLPPGNESADENVTRPRRRRRRRKMGGSPSAGCLFFSQLSIPPACVPAEEGAQTHRAHDGGQQQGHDVPGVVGFRRGHEAGEERQQSDGRCVRQLNFGSHVDAFALFLLLLPHPPPLLPPPPSLSRFTFGKPV